MKGKTILIIDDSELIREQLKSMVSSRYNFFEILEAENMKQALKIINEKIPDILIIDLALTDGNGLEIVEQEKERLKNSVKIILTNYPYKQFREKARGLNVDYFFDKSFEMNKIIDVINEQKIKNKQGIIFMSDEQINILVVDDSATLRKMVVASLKSIPNAVFFEAQNGLEAIEKLALIKINAVILDLNMPDVQGMEVLKFIKSHELYKNVKVIILTTRSDDDSRVEALRLGADIYMTKPFQPDELISKFKELFEDNSK